MLPDYIMTGPEKEIYNAYIRSKGECKPWHKRIEENRNWYNFEHYKNFKAAQPGEERYADPTPTNVVDAAVGVILAKEIEWVATPWVPAKKAEESCGKIEKYLAGTLEINNEREELHIPYEADMHFVRDGCAVIYSVWDAQTADRTQFIATVPDEQVGTRNVFGYRETPMIVQVFDPLKITVLPGGPNRWSHVFRAEKMSIMDVEQTYNCKLPGYDTLDDIARRTTKGDLVDCWRIISKQVPMKDEAGNPIMNQVLGKVEKVPGFVVQQCLLFNNKVVPGWGLRDMENYEDIPYTIGFFKPVDRNDAKDWGHGILQPLETTMIALERAFNRRSRQITVFSSMPLVSRTLDGRQVIVDAALGTVLEMRKDEDLAWPTWPGNPPDVDKHTEFLRWREQQSGFTDAGAAAGRGMSGYAMSQLADLNRVKLAQPIKHLELFWSRWARKVLRLTKNFAEGQVVRVYGRMRGKDFAEQVLNDDIADYMVKAIIQPKWPGDDVRMGALATQVRGLLPDQVIIEDYLDYDQPDDIMDIKRREMAMAHPAAQMYAAMGALQDLADEGDEVAMMVLQQMMQQGQGVGRGMGPGRPTEPPNPMQPAGGMMSSSMEPTPQEEGGSPEGQGIRGIINKFLGSSPGMGGQM